MKRLIVAIMCLTLSVGGALAQKKIKGSVSKAKSALEKNDLQTAKAEIDMAFEVDKKGKISKNADSWYQKGKIYAALAIDSSRTEIVNHVDLDIALSCFDKAVELKKDKYTFFVDQDKQALRNRFINAGVKDYDAEDFAGATEEFQNSLKVVQDSAILYYAGISASTAKLYPEAIKLYDELINEYGANETVWLNKIYVHKAMEDTLGALETAKKGALAYPENSDLAISEVQILLEKNKFDEAKSSIEGAIVNNPTSATLYYALGYIDESKGDRESAIAAYKKAMEIKPDYYNAVYNLGAVYYEWGREIRNEANEMDLRTYQKRGKEVEAKANEKFNKALPYFVKANLADPSQAGALEALRNCYNVLQMSEKAEEVQKRLDELTSAQ